jgi:hypothetical protein
MIPTVRMLVLAAVTLLALASTGHAATSLPRKEGPRKERDAKVERGIVQSISRRAIVLKELDGSTLTMRVDVKTRVFLDGKRGFVAVVKRERNYAREIRAFDPTKERADVRSSRKGHGGRKGEAKERDTP